jgi:hypothetical protein
MRVAVVVQDDLLVQGLELHLAAFSAAPQLTPFLVTPP